MTQSANHVPDLLRRFVPTPFHSVILTGRGRLRVRSNDNAFASDGVPATGEEKLLDCVLVRDNEVPVSSRSRWIEQGEVLTAVIAEGAHLHFDRVTGEIVGFARNSIDTITILYWIDRLLARASDAS